MSSRLHNKFHRHNHHTTPINDPRYPDAAHDPIASQESPFLGDFVLQGGLSASGDMMFKGDITLLNTAALLTFEVTPLTATGEFIPVVVNSSEGMQRRYIRLWNT
jgi:hypothetical protein